jgi:Raf kinase inhibitor-like YbhB/YbcL family protein
MELRLSSPAFTNGSQIPSRYTCDGDNFNPHLVLHGVPEQAKSLTLVMEDPDAPTGLWTHWIMWNIPAETKEIREHTVPFGALEGTNSGRKKGYTGPCPPGGTHRYFFRVFALDRKLALEAGAGRDELERAMEGHILATAELMGNYGRTNQAPL